VDVFGVKWVSLVVCAGQAGRQAGAGWACAPQARVMLKGKSAGECCQQGFRLIPLRWPTIYYEQGLRFSYCEPAELDHI